jgi:hypothetical protein
MLPTFLVIGAAKCGTTSLCARLGDHPDVFFSNPKEIHYFGRDDARKTLEWYEEHFRGADGRRAIGEGSTSYTHPQIIHRCVREIHERLPEARLIYMVRHPLKRLESDWRMRMHEGWGEPDINLAACKEGTTLVTHGLYWKNLQAYRAVFPDEQIAVIFLEDFASSPRAELARCFKHIGVDPEVPIAEPGKAENRSSDFRQDGVVAAWLRQKGAVGLARKVLPRTVFEVAKEVLTDPDTYAPRWDPVTRRSVWDRFVQDSARFLEHCGKPRDFWSYPGGSRSRSPKSTPLLRRGAG